MHFSRPRFVAGTLFDGISLFANWVFLRHPHPLTYIFAFVKSGSRSQGIIKALVEILAVVMYYFLKGIPCLLLHEGLLRELSVQSEMVKGKIGLFKVIMVGTGAAGPNKT